MTTQKTNLLIVDGFGITVHPSQDHEYLVESRLVAEGYGVAESTLREHRRQHGDELVKGKHWISVRNPDGNPRGGVPHHQVLWTKRGVVRLGFFIRSARAKRFRDAAEDLVVSALHVKTLPPDYASALRELADVAEQGQRLGKTVDILSPRAPYATKSRFNGEPRVRLVPSYFRSKAPADAKTVEFRAQQLEFAGWLEVAS